MNNVTEWQNVIEQALIFMVLTIVYLSEHSDHRLSTGRHFHNAHIVHYVVLNFQTN
jgi:hypothetical protein